GHGRHRSSAGCGPAGVHPQAAAAVSAAGTGGTGVLPFPAASGKRWTAAQQAERGCRAGHAGRAVYGTGNPGKAGISRRLQ
ncbi:hypothetical protein GMJFJA_GMJFJA_10850, partial [Dysosmobacter welbionis]